MGNVEKPLDKNAKIDFKIYNVINWEVIISIHILYNISRSKGNHTMNFGWSIEYNMFSIFLKKSYTKCSGETGRRPFYKKSKVSISLDQQSRIL